MEDWCFLWQSAGRIRRTLIINARCRNQKAEGLAKEADDLEGQADKLQKDDPDSIKKA